MQKKLASCAERKRKTSELKMEEQVLFSRENVFLTWMNDVFFFSPSDFSKSNCSQVHGLILYDHGIYLEYSLIAA